jgi:hypothetical protein
MLSNRTSKSFFHSFLFAHTTKKVNFQHEEIKIELEVTKSHLQIVLSFFSLCSHNKQGGFPAHRNEESPEDVTKSHLQIFLSVFVHTTTTTTTATTKRYGLPFQQRQGEKKIFSSQDGLPNQQSRC